nr:hypothetical protein [Kibdelosporangium sp. MJ126-NF4]CTQ96530.1 hypothetical protein [Kibdelosporangium sp. MJ126-NF4]
MAAAGAPAEVLAVFDGPGSPEQVLQRLDALDVMPSPDEVMSGLLENWAFTLRHSINPLEVELFGLEFVHMMDTSAPDAAEVPVMLISLAADAERTGQPTALSLLRFLSVLGPDDVRDYAGQAADRMVAAGLKDRQWAAKLGKPKPGPCFGYGSAEAGQESIALTYTYGRKSHALVVLIDHDLGGGVKDCFPTDQPGLIREQFKAQAAAYGLPFHEYQPHEAHTIMTRVLRAPLCPQQPDQIEDLDLYLPLLSARVDLLTTMTPIVSANTVHTVKVSLHGAKPPIWRRLEISSQTNLAELHRAIQDAFGWLDYHMWVFDAPLGRYGVPDPELEFNDASRTPLLLVAPGPGDRLRYTYDFGDNWDHDIVVEKVSPATPEAVYPRCLAGRRAGPPEDCGGIWGYAHLIEALADPEHEEHDHLMEWLGLDSAGEFDPARFDLAEINRRLH